MNVVFVTSDAKISMTVPVLMSYDGSEDKPTSRDKKYQMSFYTPKDFHDKAPQPTNADVYLSSTPGMSVYVRLVAHKTFRLLAQSRIS